MVTDEAPIVADDENIYWPVMVCNGYMFGRGQSLLLEREGNWAKVR